MPYMNETWIGTTDDDFYGDLDNMQATHDEVEYLLTAIERIIPSIRSQRMIGIRIGVRNTIHAWGPSEDDLSRSYEVVDHSRLGARNLFSVIGGKLASFRQQAEDAADAVSRHLGRDRIATHTVMRFLEQNKRSTQKSFVKHSHRSRR